MTHRHCRTVPRASSSARVSWSASRTPCRVESRAVRDRRPRDEAAGRRTGAAVRERHAATTARARAYPVAINLFGSMRRMSMSLGVERLDEVGDRITELLDLKVPDGLIGEAVAAAAAARGREVSAAHAGRDAALPGDRAGAATRSISASCRSSRAGPRTAGPYITLPMVISRDPKRGIRNVGMYRVQLLGTRTLAMHWQRHKVGAAHWREMAERGRADAGRASRSARIPPSMYSASAPLPPTVDEFLFAGFLRRSAGALAKALHLRSRGARRSGVRDRGLHRSRASRS